ncbi:MAG: glycosyltransferase family 9 protein [Bryobacteraceae bacterium]|nr:glycosyltransferase family 9 protein [Bryobacteraceae bacterium]
MLAIRLRSLGDCVLSTPAFHLLKRARPDVTIGVVVEPQFRAVYEGNPDIEIVGDVRAFRADVALNLHGGPRSAAIAWRSGARWRAGFAHYQFPWLYHWRIPRAQEILAVDRPVHTAEHQASAMFWLGVPPSEIPRARLFAEPSPAARPYAVIHPFASAPDKQWPPGRFVELASSLDLEVAITGGPSDDFTPFEKFRIARGTLAETKSLIAGASLFIGNDSGPAHMAAAFGVPSVVLFGPSDELAWAPWRTEAQVLKRVPLSDLRVEEVAAAALKLGVPR